MFKIKIIITTTAIRKSGNIEIEIKNNYKDFPDGPVVKNLPCKAEDTGSIPGWGTKIPHAAGQLSPRATTTEARAL